MLIKSPSNFLIYEILLPFHTNNEYFLRSALHGTLQAREPRANSEVSVPANRVSGVRMDQQADSTLDILKRSHHSSFDHICALLCELCCFSLSSVLVQLEVDRSDPRLNHPRGTTDVTQFMHAFWRMKEQSENMGPGAKSAAKGGAGVAKS